MLSAWAAAVSAALAGGMPTVVTVLIAVVAVLHGFFLILEMFLWEKPFGRKTFGMKADQAAATAVLAKNQGLYNGFLSAGLAWSIALGIEGAAHADDVATFFLACVVVAGAYGAATVNPRIFVVQGVPALLALGAVWAL